jgi:hypothetical protein
MRSALVFVGKTSHILDGYRPCKHYDFCVVLGREAHIPQQISEDKSQYFFPYDLSSLDVDYGSIATALKEYDEVDIIFAAYSRDGLATTNSLVAIQAGLFANCIQPLALFSALSSRLSNQTIRGIFVSSIYAHIAPNPKHYTEDSVINPLYYGVAKAGVEQGLRWLSVQNIRHAFNAIVLGPLPSREVHDISPSLINSLKVSMPSKSLILKDELWRLMDYLTQASVSCTRGACFFLDGGYTIW